MFLSDKCNLQALPPFVRVLVDSLVASRVYEPIEAPNHCLINDYRDGAGIPAHQDGPLYLDKVRPHAQTCGCGGSLLIYTIIHSERMEL